MKMRLLLLMSITLSVSAFSFIKATSDDSQYITRATFFRSAFCQCSALLLNWKAQPAALAAEMFVPSTAMSYKEAVEILQTQRIACYDIQEVVSSGRLDEAGFKVLQLNAQVTAAGKVVLNTLQLSKKNEGIQLLRIMKTQEKLSRLLELFGECDTLVGEALRGKMASAPAQIKILSTIRETSNAFDEFLRELSEF